jgi:hypothetical protein
MLRDNNASVGVHKARLVNLEALPSLIGNPESLALAQRVTDFCRCPGPRSGKNLIRVPKSSSVRSVKNRSRTNFVYEQAIKAEFGGQGLAAIQLQKAQLHNVPHPQYRHQAGDADARLDAGGRRKAQAPATRIQRMARVGT